MSPERAANHATALGFVVLTTLVNKETNLTKHAGTMRFSNCRMIILREPDVYGYVGYDVPGTRQQ